MAEPRPRNLTDEMKLAAATKTANSLAAQGLIEKAEVENSAKDIARVAHRNMDGYELAKALEDRRYWRCNLPMAEALDAFESEAEHEIEVAEKAWAERNNITPPFPVGTRVVLRSGETGTITGVYEHGTARFLVKMDGDADAEPPKNARWIVHFEYAQAIEQPASPSEAAS